MSAGVTQVGSAPYLFFAAAGLVVSAVPLLAVGHRLKRNHWLLALTVIAALVFLTRIALQRLFGLASAATTGPAFATAALGILVVALVPQWNAFAQVSYTFVIATSAAFLAYATQVMLYAHLGALSLSLSIVLLLLELGAFLLLVCHTFEIFDVVCRTRWQRVFDRAPANDHTPMVSLHVPAYNEPPEMVIQTLDALSRLDYPSFEVLVIDNNTVDPAVWRPVEEHCKRLGFRFFHLENWPGYKSGALNYGLRQTHPDATLVGIIDADYVVEPTYLRDLVGFFADENVGFLQTPQDYRDVDRTDRYSLACYHAYQYFFKLSMATRNERNGIIFGGTMGLIRRSVLEELGGWDEWCITEDAEVSLRILDKGLQSIFVDRTYGRGLMPLNFEGLKKQRFRWAFGGMQILRLHWATLMPWSRILDPSHRLTFGQKYDYLSGGLQWLNDPLTFAFTAILLLSSGALAVSHSVHLQPLAEGALVVPLILLLFGITKYMWAFRVRVRCSFLQAYRAFVVLLGLTWAVTLACGLGLTRPAGVFLRTPKRREGGSLIRYLQLVDKEALISLACLVAAAVVAWREPARSGALFLICLLLWQSFIYGSAVLAANWSWHSERKVLDPMRARTWRTRGERLGSMVTDFGGAVSVAGIVAVLAVLLQISGRHPPEAELIFRTNPYDQPIIGRSLMRSSPAEFVKAAIFMEEHASLRGDLSRILKLWSPDAEIRDANYTPDDPSDDHVWRGTSGVAQRYKEEFSLRKYQELSHRNVSVFIEADSAVVVNDLEAKLVEQGTPQQVYLARGDRWVLENKGGQWKIRSLTYNRARR